MIFQLALEVMRPVQGTSRLFISYAELWAVLILKNRTSRGRYGKEYCKVHVHLEHC